MEVFGIIGTSFGIIAWGLIAKLRKEFEDLKKNIENSMYKTDTHSDIIF